VIREAGKRFVVMDTAPTGHTLLLLDATGAYHREVVKRMGEKGHYLTPMMQLQDPERTKIMLVTLPETTLFSKLPVYRRIYVGPVLNPGHGSSITVWSQQKQRHRCY
jgi:anion-transporting  ArsA/GET3 family ATPase